MWPRNDVQNLLRVAHPILQAPMGGESTPAMAAAVSEAGGLGGLGCSFMSNDAMKAAAAAIRRRTQSPFNLNFFAHPEPREDAGADARARALVAPFYSELGITDLPERSYEPCRTFDEERLEAVLEIAPAVVSFRFGLLPPSLVSALREASVVILSSATTVGEACPLQQAGVDAVIAQGWEAGGHRGTFETSWDDFGIGTLALVPQVSDALDVPVVAAGGIADGRGIDAAFALGASGVQLGTAFLATPEANIDEGWRAALRRARAEDTRLTRAFSGRPARALATRYTEAMARERTVLPDFPTMYAFSDPLESAGSSDFRFLLYGQAASLSREMPFADLVRRLVTEAAEVFASMSGPTGSHGR